MRHVNFDIRQPSKLVDRKVPCFLCFRLPFIPACQPEQFKRAFLESAMKDHVPSEQAKMSRQGGSAQPLTHHFHPLRDCSLWAKRERTSLYYTAAAKKFLRMKRLLMHVIGILQCRICFK